MGAWLSRAPNPVLVLGKPRLHHVHLLCHRPGHRQMGECFDLETRGEHRRSNFHQSTLTYDLV